MKNSKKAYFEEIIFLIDVVIFVYSYSHEYTLLSFAFGLKAIFDFLCAIYYAGKSVIEKTKKQDKKIIDEIYKTHSNQITEKQS